MRPFLLLIFLCASLAVQGQSALEIKLNGSEQGKSLSSLLTEVQSTHHVKIYFLGEWIQPLVIKQSYQNQTLGDLLDDLFLGSDLNYIQMYPHALVIVKDPTQALLRRKAIQASVRQQKKIEQRVFGDPAKQGMQPVTVTGRLTDTKNGEPLQRANIQVSETTLGTTTDDAGNFKLTLAPGSHILNVSSIDYETRVIDLSVYENAVLNLEMEKTPTLLDEVVVRGQVGQEVATSRIGQTQLTMRDLKRAPAMLGEVDLIKQVQVLPGVTTVGEAASGFNVRGGSVDQNLVLYDGLPVFNSSHAFGFLSSFNSEAIRDASFFRGGIPAEYGGRISSVLDIQSRDGDYEKWNGRAGIGMITSNVMVNGPIQKDKTSVSASFRSTYSNWLVRSIRTDYADLRKSSVAFYDGTLKLSHLFSTRTKLSVTGYASKDGFRLMGDTTYQWDNLVASAKLNHQFSSNLHAEFIAGVSSYGYQVINREPSTASQLSYRIVTSVAKAGFNYQTGSHKINFGWQIQHYAFDPGRLQPKSAESNARNFSLNRQNSLENAFYVAEDWTPVENLFIEGGIRIPTFLSFGPATINTYQEGLPKEVTTIADSLQFGRGEVIKAFAGVEPRLSMRWALSPSASFKLGYNRMYQYLHLVTNTTAVTPVDIWQPSGYYFKPQRADQLSGGYFKDFQQKKYEISAEIFYKYINNILDFKDGAQLILNKHLETDLLQGKGRSYGVETFVSKNMGRVTGSLNYTYSRSFRSIAGPTASESVNRGKQYPSNFDQPHILNVSWKYNLSRKIFFTGNFTYHTGRPVTIPISAFSLEGSTVAYFSGRNQYRIPDYHRLDVALIFEGNNKRKKAGEGTFVISFYNVYARKNPYTIFFRSSGTGVPTPYQLSIIGTILPSISYNVKF